MVLRCAVIGGGISGLAAAFDLMRGGADCVLLEADSSPGGVVRSRRVGAYLFEDGPNSVPATAEPFVAFAKDLGLGDRMIRSRDEASIRHVYDHGRLCKLPGGAKEFFTTPLLTWGNRLRLFMEPFVGARRSGPEESVADFFGRRFGRGITSTFVDAIVSGIFAGDPTRLGVASAFPEMHAMEVEHGSLFGAMKARAKKRRLESNGAPRPKASQMVSFPDGLGEVPSACAAALGQRVRCGVDVTSIERAKTGGFVVTTRRGGADESLTVDRVVMATPAAKSVALLAPLAPTAAALVKQVEHASMAIAQAGFRRDALPGLPEGFGFLIPRRERLRTLGWIFGSQIFAGRADDGTVAITGFFGGVHDPSVLDLGDAEFQTQALGELATELKLPAPPRPDVFRVVRWRSTIPQYNVGHAERAKAVVAAVGAAAPGLILAGNWVAGVAVPKCILRGRAAAREALTPGGAQP